MTTRTDALLNWFHRPLTRGLWKSHTTISGSNSARMTNASPRQYRAHVRRTCYQCQQEGHYARNCPRTTTAKPAETKMEKLQLLFKSMTPNERVQFKRAISPQMTTMQAHLRAMSTSELEEFKRRITSNATQIFTAALTS